MDRTRKTVVRVVVVTLVVGLGVLVMNLPRLITRPQSRAPWFTPLTGTGLVAADSLPPDSVRIMESLARVCDPELGLSVVELGLVHRVTVDSNSDVMVVLSLTTPGCPFADQIGQQVLKAVQYIPGARHIVVKLDPMIPWDPSRVSDRAREKYESLLRVIP